MTAATANSPPNHRPGPRAADQFFQIDEARIRYREAGTGPSVVLVHGWTLDLQMWEAQSAALQDSYRVISYDRRGFGLSTGIPAVDADCTDLDAICRRVATGPVALVGMSQGVRPVLRLAQSAPERIACVVLDGPPDFDSNGDEVELSRYRELVHSKGIDAFRREWSAHPLMRLVTRDPAVHSALAAMTQRYPGRELTSPEVHSEPTAPLRPESVAAPTLVITGKADLPGRTRAADRLAARLPHSERATIPGAGHLANLDNPTLYNQLLRTFLALHIELGNPTPRSVS
jgi:3-oxoadipate enol-lactonase